MNDETKTQDVQGVEPVDPAVEEQKKQEAAQYSNRMRILADFRNKVEQARLEAIQQGYVVDVFAGVTQPYGEIGVKYKVRELTTEEAEEIRKEMEVQKVTESFKNPLAPTKSKKIKI